MTSSFGWLAVDAEQRRRMMEAVDQFRDETTIDDLGLGGIRDAFSDSLFPGTSTLHTRLRYALFIPWLLRQASHRESLPQMVAAFRESEYRLIDSLKRGNETEGVIGREAGRSLQRLPSAIYWGMISTWEIFEPGFTIRGYFERELLRREELRTTPRSDDPELDLPLSPTGLDPRLPDPPDGLLKETSFTLRSEDADYFTEAITRRTAGTLLAHLVTHRPATWTDDSTAPTAAWDPAIRHALPPTLDELVSRAERFSLVAQGASLLYNLILAETTGKHDRQGGSLTDLYTERLHGMAMAHVSVERLSPDLVILDEFQRFKELFPSANHSVESDPSDAQRLAQRLIATERAKVLVLSATPYKMYTLPDEPTGDDHYRDFTNTIGFLAGKEAAREITGELSRLREGILQRTPEGQLAAARAQQKVQAALRRVMSRTERLAATPNRDGMLTEKDIKGFTLETQDVEEWLATEALASHIRSHNPFEYWRSAPYTPNLMDRSGYQLQERFVTAAEQQDPGLVRLLREHSSALLDWEQIRRYRPIPARNAKMRFLVDDLLAHEAWRLAWIPPSLPYVEPAGVFARPNARRFTKRLIFSAWGVVPKTVAALVSYEAERRMRAESGAVVDANHRYGDRRTAVPLSFAWDPATDLPRNLPNLTVLYPCVTLAQVGDALALAREHGWSLPLNRDEALAVVTERVRRLLADVGVVPRPGAEGQRRRWYGVAPYLLDAALDKDGSMRERLRRWLKDEQGEGSRLVDHMTWAMQPDLAELGDPPEDLADVLAHMALAGPGVCALRALARVEDGTRSLTDPHLRVAAVTATKGLRSLLNKPETVAAVRGATEYDAEDLDSYWHQVLRYSLDGNLQSVLDEFVHMLTESEGLAASSTQERSETLADRIAATASIRSAQNTVQDVRVEDGTISVTERHLNSHVAARFGRAQSSEAAAEREATMREGYNAPFWPFVMASTSVGQEGLDFHTYSHAVVHWNLPSNPVDLEQREGRVHRYKGHAVRKNIAAVHGDSAVTPDATDPWRAVFAAAEATRPEGDSLVNPYWVFPLEDGAAIERYVPAMPLSREAQQYERLRTTLGAYRFVMGQPRQEDLIRYLGSDAEQLRIDLTPPAESEAGA